MSRVIYNQPSNLKARTVILFLKLTDSLQPTNERHAGILQPPEMRGVYTNGGFT